MTTRVSFTIVDVFTNTALQGNQLGVFTDATALNDSQMQHLAKELGFSECSFVFPPAIDGRIRVRIFTPFEELPFAGHPVLGTAFVLCEDCESAIVEIETAVGVVPVELERDFQGRTVFGRMKQPTPSIVPYDRVGGLLMALGVKRSVYPVEVYDNGPRHVLVSLSHADEVATLAPDMVRLAAVAGDACVSCFALDGDTVKTRMFAPGMGVREDPATGSAAGPIALHLMLNGAIPWGRSIEISQGEEIGRRSRLVATVEGGPHGVTSIEVGGAARIVARGEFAF